MQHPSELQDYILTLSTWLTAQEVLSNSGFKGHHLDFLPYMWVVHGRIFSLSVNGCTLFPAYALGLDGRPLPTMKHILSVFSGKRHALSIACWFASVNSWLGGIAPMDMLLKDGDAVLYAAKMEVASIEHG